jgi:hypothetical protein
MYREIRLSCCLISSTGSACVRCYVQGDKIKLRFNLFYRVSIVTVFRWAACSLHNTGTVFYLTICTTLHAAQSSPPFFRLAVSPASLVVAQCIVFLRLAACVVSDWINERPSCMIQTGQRGVTICGWQIQQSSCKYGSGVAMKLVDVTLLCDGLPTQCVGLPVLLYVSHICC